VPDLGHPYGATRRSGWIRAPANAGLAADGRPPVGLGPTCRNRPLDQAAAVRSPASPPPAAPSPRGPCGCAPVPGVTRP